LEEENNKHRYTKLARRLARRCDYIIQVRYDYLAGQVLSVLLREFEIHEKVSGILTCSQQSFGIFMEGAELNVVSDDCAVTNGGGCFHGKVDRSNGGANPDWLAKVTAYSKLTFGIL
jgi:hypothetical protein